MGTLTLSGEAPWLDEEVLTDQILIRGRLPESIQLGIPKGNVLWRTLNAPERSTMARPEVQQEEWLRLHGVATAPEMRLLRVYWVGVFQTKVLRIYRSVHAPAWLAKPRSVQRPEFRRVPDHETDRELQRVRTLAVRSLYALGLDYGVVRCGVGTGRRIVVLHVLSSPRCHRDLARMFARALSGYYRWLGEAPWVHHRLSLGADPEFVMQSPQGRLLVASHYFPMQGRIGCDAIRVGTGRNNKPIVELRPPPQATPHALFLELRRSLLQANRRMQGIAARWLAGAMPHAGLSLGGHVHFGGLKPTFPILRALDNYLALPLVLAEDERGCTRRPKYGFLGDFREKNHGGFEYRTLPSWLISPILTKGVLAVAALVIRCAHLLSLEPLRDPEIQRAYYTGDKSPLRMWLPKLWGDLQILPGYARHAKDVEALYDFLDAGISWDEKRDFRYAWQLSVPKHGVVER
ncbi:putative amidoligase domain-containing protein [Pasteuria penetrans]|uniref:putative amidoligase domain-containing protein n=1 Tax=Pasteuria penetrans TaxID=86005 RepID=UPI000FBC386A|nr:hypothetical protein [Pasteuria penetrans]